MLQLSRRRPAGRLDARLGVDGHLRQDVRVEQLLQLRGVAVPGGGSDGVGGVFGQGSAEEVECVEDAPGCRG